MKLLFSFVLMSALSVSAIAMEQEQERKRDNPIHGNIFISLRLILDKLDKMENRINGLEAKVDVMARCVNQLSSTTDMTKLLFHYTKKTDPRFAEYVDTKINDNNKKILNAITENKKQIEELSALSEAAELQLAIDLSMMDLDKEQGESKKPRTKE